MKIGVLGCFYGCAEILPDTLSAWKAYKKSDEGLVFSAVNAQFKEYAELGYKNEDEETRKILEQHTDLIDFLHIESRPMSEIEARTVALKDLLAASVDVVWLLDGDEVYTENDIRNIVEYVERTPQFDYYHIYMDNRIFDNVRWSDDFFPPRIIRTDRHGGIGKFTWDNDLEFADGTSLNAVVPGIVPKRVAHILHHSWRKSDARKKIAYQKRHFGQSPFTFDEETGTLGFNPAYFTYYNLDFPKKSSGNDIAMGEKMSFAVKFEPSAEHTPNENDQIRALASLASALLILERRNSFNITLYVDVSGMMDILIQRMKNVIDILPFTAELIVENPKTMTNLITVSSEECLQPPAVVVRLIEEALTHIYSPSELAKHI